MMQEPNRYFITIGNKKRSRDLFITFFLKNLFLMKKNMHSDFLRKVYIFLKLWLKKYFETIKKNQGSVLSF